MTEPLAILEGIGGPELVFIGILALLMFGSQRLPELGRSLGRAIREFKRATAGVEENLREVMREDPKPRVRPPAAPKPVPPRPHAEKTEALDLQDEAAAFGPPSDAPGTAKATASGEVTATGDAPPPPDNASGGTAPKSPEKS